MADLIETLLLAALSIALPFTVTRWDRRRLEGAALARAWRPVSWASALVFFGPLCLPAHFWLTRRSFKGVLLGIAWTMGVAGVEAGVSSVLSLLR